jgi:hypothetical protein
MGGMGPHFMICYGHEKKIILTGIMNKQHSKPFKTRSGFCGYPLLAQTYATQHLHWCSNGWHLTKIRAKSPGQCLDAQNKSQHPSNSPQLGKIWEIINQWNCYHQQ